MCRFLTASLRGIPRLLLLWVTGAFTGVRVGVGVGGSRQPLDPQRPLVPGSQSAAVSRGSGAWAGPSRLAHRFRGGGGRASSGHEVIS